MDTETNYSPTTTAEEINTPTLRQPQLSKRELFRATRQFQTRSENIQRKIFRTLYQQVTEEKELPKETLEKFIEEWVHLTRRKLKQGKPASRRFVIDCINEFSNWLKQRQEEHNNQSEEEE